MPSRYSIHFAYPHYVFIVKKRHKQMLFLNRFVSFSFSIVSVCEPSKIRASSKCYSFSSLLLSIRSEFLSGTNYRFLDFFFDYYIYFLTTCYCNNKQKSTTLPFVKHTKTSKYNAKFVILLF